MEDTNFEEMERVTRGKGEKMKRRNGKCFKFSLGKLRSEKQTMSAEKRNLTAEGTI